MFRPIRGCTCDISVFWPVSVHMVQRPQNARMVEHCPWKSVWPMLLTGSGSAPLTPLASLPWLCNSSAATCLSLQLQVAATPSHHSIYPTLATSYHFHFFILPPISLTFPSIPSKELSVGMIVKGKAFGVYRFFSAGSCSLWFLRSAGYLRYIPLE